MSLQDIEYAGLKIHHHALPTFTPSNDQKSSAGDIVAESEKQDAVNAKNVVELKIWKLI